MWKIVQCVNLQGYLMCEFLKSSNVWICKPGEHVYLSAQEQSVHLSLCKDAPPALHLCSPWHTSATPHTSFGTRIALTAWMSISVVTLRAFLAVCGMVARLIFSSHSSCPSFFTPSSLASSPAGHACHPAPGTDTCSSPALVPHRRYNHLLSAT